MYFKKIVATGLLSIVLVNFVMPIHIQASTEQMTVQDDVNELVVSLDDQYSVDDMIEIIDIFEEEIPDEIHHQVYDIPLDNDVQIEMQKIAEFYGIDHVLLLAIADKETGFDPDAIGDSGRSLGMYQIQPRWWKTDKDLHDPLESTAAACEVLSYLYENYGDTIKVLNAYNTGNPNKYNGYSNDVMSRYYDILESKHEA